MAAFQGTRAAWDIFDDPAAWIASSLPLVDLRELDDGADPTMSLSSTVRHVVVRLPLSRIDTGELASQLPPRNVPFAVLIDPHTQDARKARHMFSSDTS